MLHENLNRYPIISEQIKWPALDTVLSQLDTVLNSGIKGDIVEFGCYIGTTSLFIRRLLDMSGSNKKFHVYDSFEGLPPKTAQDQSTVGTAFQAGKLYTGKKQLLTEFRKAHLHPPIIHKSWFSELTDREVPGRIAFAFLDGDFYTSIIESLRLVWPRLAHGGSICIDDYQREALPGVERAVRDFLQDKPRRITVAHNIATINK